MTKKVLDVNELSRSRLSVSRHCFIRNEILINFVGNKKNCFFIEDFVQKAKFS